MIIERFLSKIVKTSTCWLWLAGTNGKGYGSFSVRGKKYSAHRWFYEFIKGPVNSNLDLDHLCRNRNCVNPNHLEPVTRQVNSIRGVGPALSAARQLTKTHCPRGHEYNKENTYFRQNKPGRRCNICHRIKEGIRRQNNKINKGVNKCLSLK